MQGTSTVPGPQATSPFSGRNESDDLPAALRRWEEAADIFHTLGRLSAGAALLAVKLRRHAFYWNGRAHPAAMFTLSASGGEPGLAERLGFARRSLQRHIAELREAGLLHVEDRKAERRPSVYRWVPVSPDELSTLRAQRDASARAAAMDAPYAGDHAPRVARGSSTPTSAKSAHRTRQIGASHAPDWRIHMRPERENKPSPPQTRTREDRTPTAGNPSGAAEGEGGGIVFALPREGRGAERAPVAQATTPAAVRPDLAGEVIDPRTAIVPAQAPGDETPGVPDARRVERVDGDDWNPDGDPLAETRIIPAWSARLLAAVGVGCTKPVAGLHPVRIVAGVIAQARHEGRGGGVIVARLRDNTTDALEVMLGAFIARDRAAASLVSTPEQAAARAAEVDAQARRDLADRLLGPDCPHARELARLAGDAQRLAEVIDPTDHATITAARGVIRERAERAEAARELAGRAPASEAVAQAERRIVVRTGQRLGVDPRNSGELPALALLAAAEHPGGLAQVASAIVARLRAARGEPVQSSTAPVAQVDTPGAASVGFAVNRPPQRRPARAPSPVRADDPAARVEVEAAARALRDLRDKREADRLARLERLGVSIDDQADDAENLENAGAIPAPA